MVRTTGRENQAVSGKDLARRTWTLKQWPELCDAQPPIATKCCLSSRCEYCSVDSRVAEKYALVDLVTIGKSRIEDAQLTVTRCRWLSRVRDALLRFVLPQMVH